MQKENMENKLTSSDKNSKFSNEFLKLIFLLSIDAEFTVRDMKFHSKQTYSSFSSDNDRRLCFAHELTDSPLSMITFSI